MKVAGVISDTHGLLRPEALAALEGCDLIIHAGDIDRPQVLEALEGLAPVHAVRGNMDREPWADRIPRTAVVQVEEHYLYVLHDLQQLDLDPVAAGFHVVIAGHSHRPSVVTRQGVLYLNPGSAGPPRFGLPITVARLVLGAGEPVAEILPLR